MIKKITLAIYLGVACVGTALASNPGIDDQVLDLRRQIEKGDQGLVRQQLREEAETTERAAAEMREQAARANEEQIRMTKVAHEQLFEAIKQRKIEHTDPRLQNPEFMNYFDEQYAILMQNHRLNPQNRELMRYMDSFASQAMTLQDYKSSETLVLIPKQTQKKIENNNNQTLFN